MLASQDPLDYLMQFPSRSVFRSTYNLITACIYVYVNVLSVRMNMLPVSCGSLMLVWKDSLMLSSSFCSNMKKECKLTDVHHIMDNFPIIQASNAIPIFLMTGVILFKHGK